MTYTAQECIFDLIAACGPQSQEALNRECNVQVPDHKKTDTGIAITNLRNAGLLVWDDEDHAYDLSELGYRTIVIAHDRRL